MPNHVVNHKFGTNILVDFDRRAEDKTTSNILILGNSGQGKSYLLKLILTNLRESGKRLICLDPESEYEEICSALGGCYIDFLSEEYTINPLEPKAWADNADSADPDAPPAFRKATRLMLSFISMHKDGWKKHSYAASCGVSDHVLWQMIKDNPNIKTVYLCRDNDEAGQLANKRTSDALFLKGIQHELLVPLHKDWNEDRLAAGDNAPHKDVCAEFSISEQQEANDSCQTLQL